ncbi:chalcone isomerase family protein [Permianibacter aggregans]|uniref:Chalcone isomerase-like protein n=1 Tax=Permianibacter aggregans TaxID=1510150 RepID=A0A4R6UN79_9GAMM|nr:chalcone isomerase family protein [Permianibacter aggregans]TDQ47666.1 chalcone isomerase-like protein [Permianibacter aggregans]
MVRFTVFGKFIGLGVSAILLSAASFASPSLNNTAQATATPLQQLQTHGRYHLTWFGLSIYDITLWTSEQPFRFAVDQKPSPFALEIRYKIDVDADDLIEETRDQWQELALLNDDAKRWLQQLPQIWPDIKEGDRLVMFVDESLQTRFYHNDRFVGQIDDAAFATRFSAIWLAEGAEYPDMRKALLALRS